MSTNRETGQTISLFDDEHFDWLAARSEFEAELVTQKMPTNFDSIHGVTFSSQKPIHHLWP
jgi:hypothetical protein